LPAAYIQTGRWLPLPHLIYSSFPQTLEMLWTLGLLIGDDIVPNLLAWTLAALLVATVIAFARRFFELKVGVMAAALLVLMPAFLLLSSGGYVDIGLTLYGFLALYAACLWTGQDETPVLVLSGLLAGWAIGIKYTGGITAALVGAAIAIG